MVQPDPDPGERLSHHRPDACALQGLYDPEMVCHAVVRPLDVEGIKKPTVVGISAGGGVAQMLLLLVPKRIDHVILPHCGVLRKSGAADRRTRWMLSLIRLLPLAVLRRILKRMTTGDVPAPSQWAAFHEAFMNGHPILELKPAHVKQRRERRKGELELPPAQTSTMLYRQPVQRCGLPVHPSSAAAASGSDATAAAQTALSRQEVVI